MSERNKAVVRELTEEIWNGRKLERIPDFYAADYVVDYRPYVPIRTGRDAIRETVERAFATFPDYHEEIRELIAEGEKVVVCLTISGTQTGQWGRLAPTGIRAEFNEVAILESRDGKIVHKRGYADNLTALQQLGCTVIPPRAS